MNILDKIEVVCIKIEDLHEKVMEAHDFANEPGIDSDMQLSRYLKIEEINNQIEALKAIKESLFKEAGLDISA